MINKVVVSVSLIGGLLALILTFIYGGFVMSLVASFLFFLSLLLWKYGYIIIPYLTHFSNIVEIRDGYEIPPTRDVIIKKSPNGYYAGKFMEIKFYKSVSDKPESDQIAILRSFERAISSIRYIVKISLLVSGVDLSNYVDKVKEKRSVAEDKRSKIPPNSPDASRLDREISMWNRLIKRVTEGDRPVELVSYVSTISHGLTKEDALSRVNRQAKEVSTILSSSLGCDVAPLYDLDMIKSFEWEKFFPTTMEELKDELF